MATIAYLRVSTDEQAETGLGLAAQLRAIETKLGKPDAVFSDEGISGSKANRPGLLAALDALTAGDVLAVAKRDRLGRDVMLVGWIEKEAGKRRARVVSAAGEGTGTEPADALMRHIIDAFAEFERNIIAARTAAAMAEKKVRGEFCGGHVPFGYRLAADGIRLEADQAEQAVIQKIRDLRDAGLSLRKIAAELESAGIMAKSGGRWHAETVKNVLLAA